MGRLQSGKHAGRASPVLSTDRLALEPLRVDHAAELAPWLDDPRLHRYTGGRPETLAELEARYARQAVGHSTDGCERWLNWVVRRRSDGAALGCIQATVTAGEGLTAELAWTIAVAFQRQGYAREAAGAVLGWLRTRGVRRFIAQIHPEHLASMAVARALGLVATDQVIDGELRWLAEHPEGCDRRLRSG